MIHGNRSEISFPFVPYDNSIAPFQAALLLELCALRKKFKKISKNLLTTYTASSILESRKPNTANTPHPAGAVHDSTSPAAGTNKDLLHPKIYY